MGTVSVNLLRLIVAGAAQHGADPAELLAAVRLSPSDLADPDKRFSRDVEVALWAVVEATWAHPAPGIDLAEAIAVDSYGPVGFAVRSSATLGDAYARVIRYLRLVAHGPVLRIEEGAGRARISHVPPKTPPSPSRHAVELLFGNLVMLARRGVDPTFVPGEMRFCHGAPRDKARHAAMFGPNIVFGAVRDEMEMDASWLARPQQLAEPALAAVLDEHLNALLRAVPSGENAFLDRVNRALAEELGGAGPESGLLSRIAARLRMSARTMQRRLAQEGTSLKKQLDDTRATLAAAKLRDRSHSIAEVAFGLGFSEVSTFHRAFKRWTGTTPAAYRRDVA